jgi:hypothetical protein
MVLILGANLNAKVASRPGVDEDDEVAVSGAWRRSAMAASTWSSWPSRCRAQGGRRRLCPSFRIYIYNRSSKLYRGLVGWFLGRVGWLRSR